MREKYSTLLALATGGFIFLITALFALLQSPEILAVSVRGGVAMPHPVAGHQKCDSCHGSAGIKPYPARHQGWSNGSCTRCHPSPGKVAAPEDQSPVFATEKSKPAPRKKAPPITHPVKGYEECIACHDTANGPMPMPLDHKGWQNENCKECHAHSGEASK